MTASTSADVRGTTLIEETFAALVDDSELIATLKERQLSIRFVQRDPAAVVQLSADGVGYGDSGEAPTLRFELTADTLHQLLTGRLSLPRAAAARLLTVKGPVARLRQLADVLPKVGATYAEVATRRSA
ncbi:SCP2 sterol-binding domain-containing protein [Kitasatospora sp. NBC_00374]|uniref:hypothetical protein n=1 Tax=Kitasatospora sp. NBC_00374 TaxID=2975964 RepID=UPI0030E51A4F